MSNRKVVLKMVVSLDGFATSPDGTHEWMFEFFGDGAHAHLVFTAHNTRWLFL